MDTNHILLAIVLCFLVCEVYRLVSNKQAPEETPKEETVKELFADLKEESTSEDHKPPTDIEPIEHQEAQPLEVKQKTVVHEIDLPTDHTYVVISDQPNFEGEKWVLGAGDYRAEHLKARGIPLESVASISVGPLTAVDLFYDKELGGLMTDGENPEHTAVNRCTKHNKNYTDLAKHGWNRQTSSIRVSGAV